MKRKKILKEGVQIPYRLDDFKPGDRLHIIGDYDDVSFDNFATVIATNNDIDSPYSDDAAILVHLDSPNQISGALHDSDTGIPEIRKKCRHNCWWLWMYQFNPEYNYENYRVNYDENRVIKLNDNLPDAYDVISSLYESEDLLKENYIHPGIEVGDDVIVSFDYTGGRPISVRNELATVLGFDDDWMLLEFKDWHKGNDGNSTHPGKCRSNNCFFVNDNRFFGYLDVRPSNIPDAYDVISSLYESEDLDWAMDMASDISKSIIIPGQYYRINGKIAHIPFDDTIDIYIKAVDDEVIVYDVISVGGTNWSAKHEKVNLKLASKLVNDNYWMPISKEESLFNKKRMDESEDFDWAMNMAKNIEKNMAGLSMIPRKANKYYNVILFDKPGITEGTIRNVLNHIINKTSWKSKLNGQDIKYIIETYSKEGTCYINLKPNGGVSYGTKESTFHFLYDKYFSSPGVKIIRPYSYNETINESEGELDWAMDMAKSVDDNEIKLLDIPRKLNGYYNVILFDKPGVTKETIDNIINYIQKNTEWVIGNPENLSESTHRSYSGPGSRMRPPYINLKPDGTISYSSGEVIFMAANKVSFNDPIVKIIRPYSYDETINESKEEEDFDWAIDMVNTVNLNLTSIPTKDDDKKYVILFDKPGITKETIEEIVNYIEKYTEWKFSDSPSTANNIYGYYKNDHNMETYINLRPKTTGSIRASYGSGHDVFRGVNKVSFNSPQVKVIRPYSYNETIKESEDFDWAMDMAKDIEEHELKLLEIPTKLNNYYNVILLDKPGITLETVFKIVDYIQKNTEWRFSNDNTIAVANDIYGYYKKGNKDLYINLKPQGVDARFNPGYGAIGYGTGEKLFTSITGFNFNNPKVKIIRPY